MFLVFFYYVPMLLSMPLLYFVWWPVVKKDFFGDSDVLLKHAIAFCFIGLIITILPMANWLPTFISVVYGLSRVFEDNETDHWWNKKV